MDYQKRVKVKRRSRVFWWSWLSSVRGRLFVTPPPLLSVNVVFNSVRSLGPSPQQLQCKKDALWLAGPVTSGAGVHYSLPVADPGYPGRMGRQSQRWGGHQPSLFTQNFPENCMEMKEIGPVCISHWLPLSVVSTEAPSELHSNKSVHLHAIQPHRVSNVSYNYVNQTNLLDWLIEMSIIKQNAVRDQTIGHLGHVTNQNSTWSYRSLATA